MTIQPLADRVVIKPVEAEEKTVGGIVLPGTAKEKQQIAEVMEVGPGGVVDGEKVEMQVKKGDRVIYSKYAGTEIKIGNEELVIVREGDILAIVNE